MLAKIGTAVIIPATYVGIATGAAYAYNGGMFEEGFVNGFVSSAIGSSIAFAGKAAAIRWGPKIFEYAGIALEPPGGAAVGSWVEDWIFNKDKSWEERLESSIEAAKKEIMSGIGALYFKFGVDSMNRIFRDHFPPAEAFAESIEHLVNGLMTVVSTSEVNKE